MHKYLIHRLNMIVYLQKFQMYFCICLNTSSTINIFCISENFNTNISHQLFDYIITLTTNTTRIFKLLLIIYCICQTKSESKIYITYIQDRGKNNKIFYKKSLFNFSASIFIASLLNFFAVVQI